MNDEKKNNREIVSIDEFPELPGIDRQKAHVQFRGKINLFRKILISFQNNYRCFEQDLKDVLQQCDIETSIRLAHSLKGVAGNIAATDLHSAAGKLEQACASGFTDLEIYLSPVALELSHLLAGLDQAEFMAYTNRRVSSHFDSSKVNELYNKLHDYIVSGSIRATDIVEELEPMVINCNEYSNLFKAVSNAVRGYDFDQALVPLEKLMSLSGSKQLH